MKVFFLKYTPLPERDAEHAKQKLLAGRLLEYALKEHYGLDMAGLKLAKTPKGKPYFENCPVKFSKSHTSGMVMVALSDSEVGADCQVVQAVSEKLMQRVCSEGERTLIDSSPDRNKAFALIWAKKEALVKLSGRGLAQPMKDIDTSKVTACLESDHHALAAVDETGSAAEFIFVTEGDIGA